MFCRRAAKAQSQTSASDNLSTNSTSKPSIGTMPLAIGLLVSTVGSLKNSFSFSANADLRTLGLNTAMPYHKRSPGQADAEKTRQTTAPIALLVILQQFAQHLQMLRRRRADVRRGTLHVPY